MKYPLSIDTFTLADKLWICKEILKPGFRYTQGKFVSQFEQEMGKLVGGNTPVFVNSGSGANHLLIETFLQYKKLDPKDCLVILPAVTWISSVSPWIYRGFNYIFCDINLNDLSYDYIALEKLIEDNKSKKIILFPTALLGKCPNINILNELKIKYNTELFLDGCEANFTEYQEKNILTQFDLATTSTFFSHFIVSIEGGFLFLNDSYQRAESIATMIRGHGMSRCARDSNIRRTIESQNPDIDTNFLFALLGSNFRNSEVHALFGLRDIKRVENYIENRKNIYYNLYHAIDKSSYIPVPFFSYETPFCFPLFFNGGNGKNIKDVKNLLAQNGIEYRPIISGNLLRQPVFRDKVRTYNFPNADFLHDNGFYIGLQSTYTNKDVKYISDVLNQANHV